MNKIIILFIGIIIYPIKHILKIKRNVWIFGADKGKRYSQNSKFLFEYIIKNHGDVECYWITQSKDLYNELRAKKYPVLYNFSVKGVVYALTAEVVVYTTWFNDILYTYPNDKRFFVYLMHGMPAKKVYYDHTINNEKRLSGLKSFLFSTFVGYQKLENMDFIPVTSDFFKNIVRKAMKNNNVFVTGQPRTDVFWSYDKKLLRDKYGMNIDDFIITYMPTHRGYGKGIPSPQIFRCNEKAINYFGNNNIKIIWKQHINMLEKYHDVKSCDDCFIDFSARNDVDAQELLFVSDILITDYSSCFFDFMMLGKPVLFHFYDDYATSDNQLYISEDELAKIGLVSNNEEQLFDNILFVYKNNVSRDYTKVLDVYFSNIDDKSCERNYIEIQKQRNL